VLIGIEELIKDLGLGKKLTIDIVNPGIDPAKFKGGPKTSYPSILYLGRITPWKCLDVLIRTVPKIIRRFPSLKVNIAGEGEARKDLEKLVKSLKLENVVNFLGRVDENFKLKLLAESWVFVYPSRIEGWGITAIEANASGTPVVASDVPGLRDSVKNPASGFLFPYKNEDSLAEKLNLVLSNNELRKGFELNSLAWANNFSWDKSANNFFRVIQVKMLEEKRLFIARNLLVVDEAI